jgi:hypothetical protein
MEAMNVLDKVTEAIERVLKGAAPRARTERMTPDALVGYAVSEIEKAAKEPPEKAARRLRALGRTVETAKQAFVDSESESIEVPVFEEETTASADESEKEIAPVAAEAALGSSAFAQNAEDLSKALSRVAKEFEGFRSGAHAKADVGTKVEKSAEVEWPFDMNTPEFRDGVRKSAGEPTWGDDPTGLRAQVG